MDAVRDIRKTKTRKKIKVGIYARYSSDMQSPDSANDQIKQIKYYVSKGLVHLTKYAISEYELEFHDEFIFKDEAQTGKVASREGYQKFQECIRNKDFQVAFVGDLSRLVRALGKQMRLYESLVFNEIELCSIADNITSESPNAKMFFQMKGMVNEMTNDLNAQRTKRGQEARVLSGFSSGDICYGYSSSPTRTRTSGGREIPSHFEISMVPDQAKVVNLIFDWFLKGMGYSGIAKELNERKIPSTDRGFKITGKTINWGGTAIRKILQQKKYIGIWEWGRSTRKVNPETDKIVRKDQPRERWIQHHEGKEIREDLIIVAIEKFDAVQKRIAETTRIYQRTLEKTQLMNEVRQPGAGSQTLLAGVLKCAECGSQMLQITGRKGGYYGCWMHHRKDRTKCSNKRLVGRKKIELKVTNALSAVLLNPDHLKQATVQLNEMIKARLRVAPEEIRIFEQKKRDAEKEVQNMLGFIAKQGDFSDSVKSMLTSREQDIRFFDDRVRTLRAKNVDKLLVTPYALKDRYERLLETLETDPIAANGAMKQLFPIGLTCQPNTMTFKKNHNQNNSLWYVKGKVAVGTDGFKTQQTESTIYGTWF